MVSTTTRGAIYLLCLEPAIVVRLTSGLTRSVGHYLGFIEVASEAATMADVESAALQRLDEHRFLGSPRGSPLVHAVHTRGGAVHLAQLWYPATRADERAMKNQGRRWAYCPRCTGGRHMRGPPTLARSEMLHPAPARRAAGTGPRRLPRAAVVPPPPTTEG